MADAIKSALLVDYESLHRSLTGSAVGTGDSRLADRAGAWTSAIENGRLIQPEGKRRRFVVKRVYAGSGVLGKQRDALIAAGFEVVDLGTTDSRSSADLNMAMDTVDALVRPDGAEEFILLTADGDLTPLLSRLRASKRRSAIYADANTKDADRKLADSVLDGTDFAIFLTSEASDASASRQNAAADRADIEAFARKIHAATNIPLFSPKTFAELFRHLTDEIADSGYHFQTTAKNVADRMTAAGRNVNRRQVVFIVKGLALKGHVFSTNDTPERLAEVFREQARYLITNAGMSLDERQDALLTAWFLGSASSRSAPAPAAPAERPKAAEPPPPPPVPVSTTRRVEPKPPQRQPEKPKPASARPTASAKPPAVKPVDMPKSTARPGPSPAAREEAKAVIAARIAGAAKIKPGRGPAPKAAPRPTAAPAQANARPANQPDPLETSILAAIAEAVDVLVDDDQDFDTPKQPGNGNARRQEAQRPEPEPEGEDPEDDFADDEPPPDEPRADEPAESTDIGDQIQRIIASYNRNRTDE